MGDHTTHKPAQEIPYGYCHCGCGEKTSIAKKTESRYGWIKGQPKRFVKGHHVRLPECHPRKSVAIRFFKYVTPGPFTDCWLWRGYTNNKGYGLLSKGGRGTSMSLAHRISWEIHFGPIPDDLWCLHKCDTPLCCNPYHLFLGTAAENTADMLAKGRSTNKPRS